VGILIHFKKRWNVREQHEIEWLAAALGCLEQLLHHNTRMGQRDPVKEGPGWIISEKEGRHDRNASHSHLVVDGDSTPLALACRDALRQYSAGVASVGVPA
jgi:hypothetical protein